MQDELLKLAIGKYGFNNWDRCASLLSNSGKTAIQCKERWYNWLNPEIKKVEWTLEEDERLLRVAEIFKHQWKTISKDSPRGTQTKPVAEHNIYTAGKHRIS